MSSHRNYRLLVAGQLDQALCDHYGGQLTQADAYSVYEFCVADQTQLHGILAHLRDYAMPIIQLVCTDPTGSSHYTPDLT